MALKSACLRLDVIWSLAARIAYITQQKVYPCDRLRVCSPEDIVCA